MLRILLVIVVSNFVLARPDDLNFNPFKNAHKWVEKINNDTKSTWTAGVNFNPDLPASYVKNLLGMLDVKNAKKLPTLTPITEISENDIPSTFDSRKKWKKCKSLQQIRDQGNCGSCWAVAAASAFADRVCIASKGKKNYHLSAEDLMDCCREFGFGCNGGFPEYAWDYFITHGLATGGDYGSNDGCQPYSKQPCEHHISGSRPQCSSLGPTTTPDCKTSCSNKKYKIPYKKDKIKAKDSYILPSSVSEIQKEILRYGPVEAGFSVYDDFLSYKKGVYQRSSSSKYLGGHAVKLIGWGTENGSPYWLVQNSWNYDWGDKGLFKIYRGANECGFESRIVAGTPNV